MFTAIIRLFYILLARLSRIPDVLESNNGKKGFPMGGPFYLIFIIKV